MVEDFHAGNATGHAAFALHVFPKFTLDKFAAMRTFQTNAHFDFLVLLRRGFNSAVCFKVKKLSREPSA